jgi:hypothetical protein
VLRVPPRALQRARAQAEAESAGALGGFTGYGSEDEAQGDDDGGIAGLQALCASGGKADHDD